MWVGVGIYYMFVLPGNQYNIFFDHTKNIENMIQNTWESTGIEFNTTSHKQKK